VNCFLAENRGGSGGGGGGGVGACIYGASSYFCSVDRLKWDFSRMCCFIVTESRS